MAFVGHLTRHRCSVKRHKWLFCPGSTSLLARNLALVFSSEVVLFLKVTGISWVLRCTAEAKREMALRAHSMPRTS